VISIIKRWIIGLFLVFLLGACTTTVVVQPFGVWGGTALFNGQYYAGAIAANYNTQRWAWCSQVGCVVGHTEGWDLVDSVGDRLTGRYDGSVVYVKYEYDGDILTSTMTQQDVSSASLTVARSDLIIRDLLP